ncbi:MAG: neutral/alkaline non-lysosomal ceramidase N-terminal domain-containing protein [Cyclobacteriaceae bacterium]
MMNRAYYIRYFLIRLLRLILIIAILLFILCAILFSFVNRPEVSETDAYQKTMAQLDSFSAVEPLSNNDTFNIGWAKSSITPDFPSSLAGYGGRKEKIYSKVNDSVFVRSFVFQNNEKTYAIVSADLLIFPPKVIDKLQDRLPEKLNLSNTYFTATHTHSSIGGWQPGIVGELFAGEYDEEMIDFIARQVIRSLEKAMKKTSPGMIGFQKIKQDQLIRNRLVKDKGTTDPWLRLITLRKATGEKALIFNYAAHATALSYHFSDLSGDYPAKVVQLLEQDTLTDFAAYMAGAVGSMSPDAPGLRGYEKVDFVAEQLTEVIGATIPAMKENPIRNISFNDFNFLPGNPQFKITEDLRLREWAFEKAFGVHDMEITSMKIGNLLLVGVPCDFSGELVAPLEKYAAKNQLELIITSFNGGYAGYVTKDEWYDLNKYETRTMNWYGHQIGEYMSEVIIKIIDGYAGNH